MTPPSLRAKLTRRQLLAAGAATGIGVLGAACGQSPSASTVRRSAAVAPAGSDLGAVEHVIFLMMENRSFDHYYGSYPGVRGFDDHPSDDLGAFSQPYQPLGSSSADGRLLPFHLDTVNTDIADCTFDLTHNLGPSTSAATTERWMPSCGSTRRWETKGPTWA